MTHKKMIDDAKIDEILNHGLDEEEVDDLIESMSTKR